MYGWRASVSLVTVVHTRVWVATQVRLLAVGFVSVLPLGCGVVVCSVAAVALVMSHGLRCFGWVCVGAYLVS